MNITAIEVKQAAYGMGADLCGIAPIASFENAPEGFHPADVLPGCKSVAVFAVSFLNSTLHAKSTIPYTTVRNALSTKLNMMAVDLSRYLEERGLTAVPINTVGPDEYDSKTGRFRGIISLKHAAELAGLGRIGKNTLLVNEKYGNMIWLNAVLVLEALEPDPPVAYDGCIKSCRLCLEICPVKALDGITINQKVCWNNAFGEHNGGEWRIKCYACRKICPNCTGIRK